MTYVCPRVIRGNRGDLLSRYGILSELRQMGIDDITVFCHKREHIGSLDYSIANYGSLYNLIPTRQGLDALTKASRVLWTAGLDLQDDSSLLKLVHTLCVFSLYRQLGLAIYILMQGAGPLRTRWGKGLARMILDRANTAVVRDSGTRILLEGLGSKTQLIQAYDGIFLGHFDVGNLDPAARSYIKMLVSRDRGRPLIGFNIRQWFHFASSVIPYQYAQRRYAARSHRKTAELVEASRRFVVGLRQRFDARVLLISMYEPGTEPWEDDLPYLRRLKQCLGTDDSVILVEEPLNLQSFCSLMARLDLMVGARLHSTLAAVRFGVPAINLSYTLKGKDIYADLEMPDRCVELTSFMAKPDATLDIVERLLNRGEACNRLEVVVDRAIRRNRQVLGHLIAKDG